MNAFIKAAVRVVMATLVVMFLFGTIDLIGPTDALAEPYLSTGSINDLQGTMGKDKRSWRQAWANNIVGEGTTSDAYESYVGFTDPTADNIILFPNSSGTVQLSNNPGFTGTPVDGDLNIYNAGDGLFRAQGMSGDVGIANDGVATIQAEAVETSMILNCPDGQVFMSTDASSGSVACVALSLTGDVVAAIINAGTGAATIQAEAVEASMILNSADGRLLISTDASSGSVAWVDISGDIGFANDGAATVGSNKIGTVETNLTVNRVDVVVGTQFGNVLTPTGTTVLGLYSVGNVTGVANVTGTTGQSFFFCTTVANTYVEVWNVVTLAP